MITATLITIISREVNCFFFRKIQNDAHENQMRLQTQYVTHSRRYCRIGLPYYCNLINRFNSDSAADLEHCSVIASLY